jgi:hypothetical protein
MHLVASPSPDTPATQGIDIEPQMHPAFGVRFFAAFAQCHQPPGRRMSPIVGKADITRSLTASAIERERSNSGADRLPSFLHNQA